jgi:hypothetical protein
MRQGAYLIGLLLSVSLAHAGSAGATGSVALGFECVTRNLAGDCAIGESQLSLVLSDAGSGAVRFELSNAGPDGSVISEVYFDDGALLGATSIAAGPGVDFAPGARPPNLPGWRSLDPIFAATLGLAAESRPSPVMNGVGPGEWLAVEFDLRPGRSFQDVLAELASGELRVGLHVIAFESRGSESFVNLPVPEPGTGGLVAGGLLALAWRARSRCTDRSGRSSIAPDR